MSDSRRRPLNLLALPPLQRRILVYLSREGPAKAATLAEALGQTVAEIEQTLTVLAEQEHIWRSPEGIVEPALGRTRRRTLPARLWPALTASYRLYSAQEIATLRTVIPILQLARAKLGEFTDHGPGHVLRVKSFATQLAYILDITATEHHLLRAAALFHDVGNIVERERHHIISQETVEKLTAAGQLPFSASEATLVGLLCRWHRKEYDAHRVDELRGETIRTGLLASILRIADAMDIDYRRSDYNERFMEVLSFFYPDQLEHWSSLEEVLGLRICCTPAVKLHIYTHGLVHDNVQIAMLRKDLNSTPLGWSIGEVAVADGSLAPQSAGRAALGAVLLACPFEPHSLIMAALSRQNLQAAGYDVELLCYPDSGDAPAWLWRDALATPMADFARLVVINDRPDPSLTADLLATARRWQMAGATVHLLNRHEANWARLPALLQQGIEATLGGDWVYFWGDPSSRATLAWGRIAALCTRDPAQSPVGLTLEEQAISQGLLKLVYDATRQAADDIAGWVALAAPILERIEADDRAYFASQAADFITTYATATVPGRVEGGVLLFVEQAPGQFPQTFYWLLEAAIERQGRVWERGIRFNTPYAIATWPVGDAVELLAINHWRDEGATPIRLLYPTNLGPPPEGNESAIRVRLSAAQAEEVIQALVTACNEV